MSTGRPCRIAIVGAGPAGIFAADNIMKSHGDASVDIFERLPAPFGLIRYGVAPDHPRIKTIIAALHKILDKPQVRLFGNVDYGKDIDLATLRRFYDAVVFATGANADRVPPIHGTEHPGSYGAADFVSWYDGHPDVPRTWPLDAERVAVLGVGNVALDVARILAKTAGELLPTEIPPNVYDGLVANRAREIHVFGRRGPAQAKFSPLELRELDHSPSIDVIIDPHDIAYDEGSVEMMRTAKQVKMVADVLENYASRGATGRPHKLFLHFFESPVEILGGDHGVVGLRTERTEVDSTGQVTGTGKFTDWDVQAVYRATGYLSRPIDALPFDARRGVVPNDAGRVVINAGIQGPGRHLRGVFVTGWVKRGPVGLIGHTKSDAAETVARVLEDLPQLVPAHEPDPDAVRAHLVANKIRFTTWDGWTRLDAHERELGAAQARDRIKVVAREAMITASEPRSARSLSG